MPKPEPPKSCLFPDISSGYMVPTKKTAVIKQAGRALAVSSQVLEFDPFAVAQRHQREVDLLDDLNEAFTANKTSS